VTGAKLNSFRSNNAAAGDTSSLSTTGNMSFFRLEVRRVFPSYTPNLGRVKAHDHLVEIFQ
jgi:hypothetical protein